MSSQLSQNSKHISEVNNPCTKEHAMSYKCLNENNYDHDACRAYFDNYKNCNAFWNEVQLTRRRQGKSPYLPEPGERAKIKEEYIKNMKKE